jgi:hypothetical protein
MSAPHTTGKDTAPPLPSNLEAERSVLGGILLDNSSIVIARQILEPENFFLPQHIHLFGHMLEMHDKQMAIDLVILTEECHKAGELELVGGAPYLASLVDGMPRVSNIEHHARIVKEKTLLRNLIHATAAIQQRAFEAEEIGELLNDADRRIQHIREISTSSNGTAFHKISELAAGEPEWIIEGYIEEGLSFLGAKSGVAKTWLGISEGKSLRTGESFLGVFPVPMQRSVLYLVPEMTERRFRSRCEKLGVDINDPGFLVRTMNDGAPLPLNDPSLRRCIERLQPVIYLDTAVRFGGGKEENSAGEVSQGLISATYQLIKLGSPSVRGLHHRAKDASDDELTLENVLRGSGDFGASAVCVWGAAHETALRAGKFNEFDSLGRKKPDDQTRKKIEREYLEESRKFGRCYLQCVKPGDRELLLWDFRIQLSPSINESGKIEMLTAVFPTADKGLLIDHLLTQKPDATWEDLGSLLGVHRNTGARRATDRGWIQDEQTGLWGRK